MAKSSLLTPDDHALLLIDHQYLVVHVSFSFGRLLVKFIGTHAEYNRIDPETVSWQKK